MDADLFLQQFGHLAQGEGGIKKLRDVILQLAVRGKLVEQNPADEPAEVLLKKIETERKALIKQGKIKARAIVAFDKPVPPDTLPYSWKIAAIDRVVLEIKSGGTPSKANASFWTTNNGIFWASVKDLKFGEKYISSTQDMITELALHDNKTKLAKAGEFLICTRMGLGKISICACDMAFNQDLKAVSISANIDPSYFHIFFQTLTIKGTGTTVDGIVQEKLLSYPFPLPPLAEQKRIVAKVDELMALCDKLEAEQKNQRTLKTQAVQSTLHHLTSAESPASFGTSLNILERTFGNWFDDLATVKHLRATILQLAVQGKLVPQNPTDEPASELLKRIEAEKKRLVKEGKIGREKTPAPMSQDDQPYLLPEKWEWVRLGAISASIQYGYTASADSTKQEPKFVRITDIHNSRVNWETVPGCDIESDKLPTYQLAENDFLIARTGGTIGKSFLVTNVDFDSVFASYLIRIRTFPSSVLPQFLKCYLDSPLYWEQLYAASMGTGQPNVNGTSLGMLKTPLPPLAEQKRIVAKVDELMVLCDQLEAHITRTQTLNTNLMDSLIHRMTDVAHNIPKDEAA